MSDDVINCADCRTDFVFSQSEAAFYESKGLTKPKRCKPCRDKRKAAKAAEGGAPAAPTSTGWVGGGEEEPPRRSKGRDRRRDRGREF